MSRKCQGNVPGSHKNKSFNIQLHNYEVSTLTILSLNALMSKIYGNELATETILLFQNETLLRTRGKTHPFSQGATLAIPHLCRI